MIAAIFLILLLLWIMGYVRIGSFFIPDPVLFTINSQPITVFKLLILIVIMWAIEALPSPFRQIAIVIFILWVLSILGIIAVVNLSSILILALIVGLALSLLTG